MIRSAWKQMLLYFPCSKYTSLYVKKIKTLSFHSFCKLKINKNFAFTKEKIQLDQLMFLMLFIESSLLENLYLNTFGYI